MYQFSTMPAVHMFPWQPDTELSGLIQIQMEKKFLGNVAKSLEARRGTTKLEALFNTPSLVCTHHATHNEVSLTNEQVTLSHLPLRLLPTLVPSHPSAL